MRTCARARTHARTHTHTHIHTYTQTESSDLAVMGFCFGGGKAIRYTTMRQPAASTIVCYGAPVLEVWRLACVCARARACVRVCVRVFVCTPHQDAPTGRLDDRLLWGSRIRGVATCVRVCALGRVGVRVCGRVHVCARLCLGAGMLRVSTSLFSHTLQNPLGAFEPPMSSVPVYVCAGAGAGACAGMRACACA